LKVKDSNNGQVGKGVTKMKSSHSGGLEEPLCLASVR
jgi:hypothetical protein